MTVNIRQITAGLSSQKLGTAVPGSTVILSTSDASADVVWDTAQSVTFATGAFVPENTVPLVFQVPPESRSFDIWVISGTGTHTVSLTVISPG
jgi:hypothetical protein